MRRIAIGLLIAAVPLAVFWYWGVYTDEGRRQFDEMSGILPLLSGVIALLFDSAGTVLLVLSSRRK
ncbi:MAG: hypothetical protein ABI823_13625 [Bryobacteraceae bacterium]